MPYRSLNSPAASALPLRRKHSERNADRRQDVNDEELDRQQKIAINQIPQIEQNAGVDHETVAPGAATIVQALRPRIFSYAPFNIVTRLLSIGFSWGSPVSWQITVVVPS
jgi:hypothetical protein